MIPPRLRLPLAAIALFLLALPAALGKPGLPFGLRGDEGTWLGMAGSLAFDRDLALDQRDLDRLFAEFPFGGRIRLELAAAAAPEHPRYGSPLLYPLLAAPFVRALGANGMLVFNVALLLLAAALVAWRLGRRFDPAYAWIFALGFFVWSPAFVYALWHRPGVLLAALGSAAAVFGWPDDERPTPAWHLALAGAALALAALHQPALALLALPLLLAWHARGDATSRRALRALAAAFGATLLLGGLAQRALVGDAFGRDTLHYTVTQPSDHPWESGRVAEALPARPFTPARLALAWIDQRRGFLAYCPLAVVALLLCRLPRRRLALGLSLAALITAQPWIGELDPELLGNPAWLGFVPFFALFVDRLPARALVLSYLAGMLVTGPYFNGLLGALDGYVHGHTRALPFRVLPLDPEEAHELGGYWSVPVAGEGVRLLLPVDVFNRVGDEVFLLGGEQAHFFLESPQPLEGGGEWQIRSVAVPNKVTLSSEAHRETLHFLQRPPIARRLLPLGEGVKLARGTWVYPLHASASRGAKSFWYDPNAVDATYVGAALAYLGTPAEIARDLYALEWRHCGGPQKLRAGGEGLAIATVANTSAEKWPSVGASQIRFASRWLHDGNTVAENPDRTAMVRDLPPGDAATLYFLLKAPASPGRYQLEFDAVRENVAWFHDKRPVPRCRLELEVVP